MSAPAMNLQVVDPPEPWIGLLSKSDRGVPYGTHDNVVRALTFAPEWEGVVVEDLFRVALVLRKEPPFEETYGRRSDGEWTPREWTDDDTVRLCVWLARKARLHVSNAVAFEALKLVAALRQVHPVRTYLLGATVHWDGNKRVDTWLTTYASVPPGPYASFVGRWWLLSAVKRIFDPGCKADYTLIFEGDQGEGKSTLLKTLCPNREWFLDTSLEVDSKDSLLLLRGKWIVEFAELESFGRSGTAKLKAFLTRTVDEYRPPYGRHPISVPRQAVFAGTVNQDDYLQDDTGGRRFWPVRVGAIDVKALERDRDQLWAEAMTLSLNGAVSWPTKEQQRQILAPEQDARYVGDAWEERVLEYVSRPTVKDRARDGITSGELLETPLGITPGLWTLAHTQRLGRVMRRLGWTRKLQPPRAGGERRYAYYPAARSDLIRCDPLGPSSETRVFSPT